MCIITTHYLVTCNNVSLPQIRLAKADKSPMIIIAAKLYIRLQ